jgi:hypothetical protein
MKPPAEKSSRSSAPRLWGELVPGPYAVGFQSFILHDYSRRFELPGVPEGASHYSPAGRPLAVQVWYLPLMPLPCLTKAISACLLATLRYRTLLRL